MANCLSNQEIYGWLNYEGNKANLKNSSVYRRRWIVLAVISLLNNINTMSWIAFSPVANHVDAFYMPVITFIDSTLG